MMSKPTRTDGPIDRALDAALGQAFEAPRVTNEFRERVRAALTRAAVTDIAELRARLETERRETLAKLEADYIRLKRRTLGAMVGGAFGAGAAAAIALPWMAKLVGPAAPLAVASIGAAVGIGIAVSSWLASRERFGSQSTL